MSPCPICGEPQEKVTEKTDTGTVTRIQCTVWKVHPIFLMGKYPRPGYAVDQGVKRT